MDDLELEECLRMLKLADPPAGRALAAVSEALSLGRHLRLAWGAAAAAAVLALAVFWRNPARFRPPAPAPGIPQELVALDPTLPFKARRRAVADSGPRHRILIAALLSGLDREGETP